MKRFAVQATVNERIGKYTRTAQLPTFYVYATDKNHALVIARNVLQSYRAADRDVRINISIEEV